MGEHACSSGTYTDDWSAGGTCASGEWSWSGSGTTVDEDESDYLVAYTGHASYSETSGESNYDFSGSGTSHSDNGYTAGLANYWDL